MAMPPTNNHSQSARFDEIKPTCLRGPVFLPLLTSIFSACGFVLAGLKIMIIIIIIIIIII